MDRFDYTDGDLLHNMGGGMMMDPEGHIMQDMGLGMAMDVESGGTSPQPGTDRRCGLPDFD